MKHTYLKLGLVFGLSLVLVFVSVRSRKRPPAVPPALPLQLAQPPPAFVPAVETLVGATFVYAGPKITLPAALPVYRSQTMLSLPVLEKQIKEMAQTLGFSGSPSAFVRQQNYAAAWTTINSQLSFAKTGRVRALSYQLLLSNKRGLPPDTDEALIRNFLKNLRSENALFSLSLRGQQTSGFAGLVILDQPPPFLRGYTFAFVLDKYPLLTLDFSPVSVAAVVDDHGQMRSLTYVFPPETIAPQGEAALIPLESAVYSLSAGRGILLSVQNRADNLGASPAFQKVNLLSLELVYVQKDGQLLPAYLFSGAGSGDGGPEQLVEYLVMASQ